MGYSPQINLVESGGLNFTFKRNMFSEREHITRKNPKKEI
jgi:hypothetical protein